MLTTTTDEELRSYNVSEAADVLGVSARTLWRYIAAGTIPIYRVGRQVRIRRARLLEWIREQENEAMGK